MMIHRLRDLAKDSAGVAAIEFAFLAPVLFMLLVGTAKFGLALNNYVMLTEAVADGARQLALGRGAANSYTTTTNQVKSTASNLTAANLTITLSVNGTACTSDSTCQTALSTAAGQPASVTATYPCDLLVMGVNFAPGCTLSSRTTEMIE
jgi:Flp pilus assembly protein TadG